MANTAPEKELSQLIALTSVLKRHPANRPLAEALTELANAGPNAAALVFNVARAFREVTGLEPSHATEAASLGESDERTLRRLGLDPKLAGIQNEPDLTDMRAEEKDPLSYAGVCTAEEAELVHKARLAAAKTGTEKVAGLSAEDIAHLRRAGVDPTYAGVTSEAEAKKIYDLKQELAAKN